MAPISPVRNDVDPAPRILRLIAAVAQSSPEMTVESFGILLHRVAGCLEGKELSVKDRNTKWGRRATSERLVPRYRTVGKSTLKEHIEEVPRGVKRTKMSVEDEEFRNRMLEIEARAGSTSST